jgi:hypothetical protein
MKEQHPLDILSFVFGVLFVVLAIPVLLVDTPLTVDARWLWPAAIIVLGALIAASGLRRNENADDTPNES